MKLLTPALLAATALSVALPAAAQAQTARSYQDCEAQRQNRQVAGAIIGGLLGAVVGNEIADDSNNNRRGYDLRGRYDRYDRHGRYDRYSRHSRYGSRDYYHRDRGNSEEVGTIAGAGVGALIGAGIASGEDCYTRSRTQGYDHKPAGYGDAYSHHQGYGYEQGYGQAYGHAEPYADPHAYQEPRYASDPYYGDGYGASSGELLGGAGSSGRSYDSHDAYGTNSQARAYSASSAMNCRWQETRRLNEYGQAGMDRVWMCQGSDGIWRPGDTYTQ